MYLQTGMQERFQLRRSQRRAEFFREAGRLLAVGVPCDGNELNVGLFLIFFFCKGKIVDINQNVDTGGFTRRFGGNDSRFHNQLG